MSLDPSRDQARGSSETERDRLYAVFQQAPMPVAIIRGPEFIYELSNSANQRYFNNEQLIGRPVRDVPGATPELLQILQNVYTQGESFVGRAFPIYFYVDGERKLHYVDFVYHPLRDANGNVEAILVAGTDVTESVTAQKRAEQSEAQLRWLLDTIPQIVWTTTPNKEILFFNRRWWEYTGLSPNTFKDEDIVTTVHPDDLAMVIEKTDEAFRTSTPFQSHYRIRSGAGDYHWHLGRLQPVKDKEGRVVQWFGTATDVDELIEAQSRFQAFFEQSSLPMEIYDLDGTPVQVNRAWVRLFDTTLDQLEGYNVLTDPQAQALGITSHLQLAISGAAVEVPAFYYDPTKIGKQGRPRWLESSFFPVKDSTGTVRELAMILRDVTDRELAEQKLKESNEQLALAVRARQDLLNICGHELKTPLSSLKLQTQTAKRRIAKGDATVYEPARVQKLLESYGNQIDRLVHLVDDMLDLTRISGGKLTLNPERIILSSLVLDVLDRFADQLAAANCSISTSLAPNVIGHWDRFRIEQVLTNLLTNAIKYGEGSPVFISVSRGKDGQSATLVVKDEGMGIAVENQERIFNRFERAVSANEVSGLGLGLFISREIVVLHGGNIRVESQPGRGASFFVDLPINGEAHA